VYGNSFIATSNVQATLNVSATANVTGGNILTGGISQCYWQHHWAVISWATDLRNWYWHNMSGQANVSTGGNLSMLAPVASKHWQCSATWVPMSLVGLAQTAKFSHWLASCIYRHHTKHQPWYQPNHRQCHSRWCNTNWHNFNWSEHVPTDHKHWPWSQARATQKLFKLVKMGLAGSTTLIDIGPATATTAAGLVTFQTATRVAIANTSGTALSVAGNITGGNVSTLVDKSQQQVNHWWQCCHSWVDHCNR
jgi:hypothetical protein